MLFVGLMACAIDCACVVGGEGDLPSAGKAQGKPQDAKSLGDGGNNYSDLPVPLLGVRQEDLVPLYAVRTYVWVRMPQIESYWNVLDLNIYEEPRDLKFLGHRLLEGGTLELRHRRRSQPHLIIVTELTPGPGRLKIVARPELDSTNGTDKRLPDELPALNVCCNARRSRDAFDSYPDPLPEFAARCFIFTDKGPTFLSDTVRRKLPKAAADDPRTNPPWIQDYSPVWLPTRKPVTGNTWYNWSPDRYTVPVIGVVSRDRKHLAALACDSSIGRLAQAWGPCIHNYPAWIPRDAPPADRRWRMNLYIMPNDPESLLERVAQDLPDALKLKANRVP